MFDGKLAAVVKVHGDDEVPEDHVALWFGSPDRKEREREDGATPEAWTVPIEYCSPAPRVILRH